MTTKKTKEPPKKPSAQDVLAKAKAELEAEVLKLCNRFERDTGLYIYAIKHPRDDMGFGDRRLPGPLEKDARVEVGVVVPFIGFFRPR